MYIRVKSPEGELAEQYAREEEASKQFESVEMFLSRRCWERAEIIHEVSSELAQLQLNYEDVVKRLRKYEPNFVEPEVRPYSINSRLVSN